MTKFYLTRTWNKYIHRFKHLMVVHMLLTSEIEEITEAPALMYTCLVLQSIILLWSPWPVIGFNL